jgi:hypothetical protein
MGLFKPDPPQPPNPIETARASTSTNVATGVANAFLNNVNQVTPQGSLNYNATGNYAWNDPVTGTTYNIPTFTATQTLSPSQQAIQAQHEGAQYNLAGMANAQSGRISGLLSNEMDISGAPGAGDASRLSGIPQAATSFDPGGPIQGSIGGYGAPQSTFGEAGDITRSYGPEDNFSADRARVEDSLMQRMNPQLQRERSNIEQRLADQGIRYGSQAYASAMDDYNRQSNDARFAAVSQAGSEQQRMNQMAAQRAAFENAAQGQAYGQAQGRGNFANDAQAQAFQQALGAGGFANQAQAQEFQQNAAQGSFYNSGLQQQMAQEQSAFNAQQAARNSYMNEQYAQRNQPINEISALLSGSQVNNPNFVNTPSSQIPTTDMAGLINNNFNQQMGVYQQQNQNYQSLMGGILGLGAGALKASDIRVKDHVERIGTVFSASDDDDRDELPIYRYSYKGDPSGARHTGPMAQDVEKIDSKAVKTIGGVKHIDTRRVMGNILRAA